MGNALRRKRGSEGESKELLHGGVSSVPGCEEIEIAAGAFLSVTDQQSAAIGDHKDTEVSIPVTYNAEKDRTVSTEWCTSPREEQTCTGTEMESNIQGMDPEPLCSYWVLGEMMKS